MGYDNTLKIISPGNSSAQRLTIEEIKGCSCGVVVLFLDKDNNYRMLGLGDYKDKSLTGFPVTKTAAEEPTRVFLKEQKGTTGDALDSDKQEELSFGRQEKVKVRYYTGSTTGLF